MRWTITWGGGPEDVALETEGPVTIVELDQMIQEALDAPEFRPGMKVLIDHSRAVWAGLGVSDLGRREALVRRDLSRIGRQQLAVVLSPELGPAVGSMFEAFANTIGLLEVRVFASVADARAWLAG